MQTSSPRIIPHLPVPEDDPAKDSVSRWLRSEDAKGSESKDEHHETHRTQPWYSVLWLTGVDYFSSLGYQPGIALLAAGAVSPLATVLLLIVTLGGALPIYAQVAKRSFAGQGSIAMLEKLLPGWSSKVFVLVMLGFASTDFIITMTLSASDAAEHLVHNPFLEPFIASYQLPITLFLLALLAGVFLVGFSEAVSVAVAVGIPYIALNIIVIGRCFIEISQHPDYWNTWETALFRQGDVTGLLILSALTFPKLALGLSGFETGVSVMPLIRGDKEDKNRVTPEGRIRGTQILLTVAAVLMSGLLITSSFVTTLLIAPADYAQGGKASGRALAYLSHSLLGETFGTIYDLSTIAILWFAGASAMAGLLNIIPRYLPRFGMVPSWVKYTRPLVLVLFSIDILVTVIFKGNVDAQGGAYATGVLALILSAAVAVSLALSKEATETGSSKTKNLSRYFWAVSAVFLYTFITNIIERPDGIIIASCFIVAILVIGAISRWRRATELRVEEVTLVDDLSTEVWPDMLGKKVCLVPLISNDPESRIRKAEQIRALYTIDAPLAFLHVTLRDDRSEFVGGIRLQVSKIGDDYCLEAEGAVALANTIAYLSELIDPVSLHLGLTRKNMTYQSIQYLIYGVGETGLMVYQILIRYWEWSTHDDIRPRIFLMSD